MKKEETPEDVGKAVAFLASDDAHNITGQANNADGGRRMNQGLSWTTKVYQGHRRQANRDATERGTGVYCV